MTTTWREDTRRKQATEVSLDGGAILDIFRGQDDQIIAHLREYNFTCYEDHFRWSVDAIKEAVANLELCSVEFTKVFVTTQDDSKSRRFVACLQGDTLYATNTIENAAQENFQVVAPWKEVKKAFQKAWRKPK